MPRSKRIRIAKGVYRDGSGIAGVAAAGEHRREHRWPLGTDLATIQDWQRRTRRDLERLTPKTPRGTLTADIARYVRQIQHLTSWRERRAELRAWEARFGGVLRSRITADHVRQIVGAWSADGVAQKTLRNRVWTLSHLYHLLDGEDTPTPCDEVRLARPIKTPPIAVTPAVVVHVDAQLQAHETSGVLRSAHTRARFRVLAACGRRPSELMRTLPTDVDLERRVWTPRNGKGGLSDPIYLNDDMLAAWELFVKVGAWGTFCTSSFARVLHHCGWPETVRPYNLRHSVGIAMSDAGIDLADVQVHMGHSRIATTRHFYVPAARGRMQLASAAIDHRFAWTEGEGTAQADAPVVAPKRGTKRKSA
jgi:integrase